MMRMHDIIDFDLLREIPKEPQVQCSLRDQLIALEAIAVRFGLYDAADYLRFGNARTQARIKDTTP